MKNIKWYSLVIILGLMTFVSFSCKDTRTSSDSLRIISINKGNPLIVDVRDWYPFSIEQIDSVTAETTFRYLVKDWIVPIELNYYEIGLGLPTYPTSYTARCTSYTVIFNRINIPTPAWRPNITGATNIIVESNSATNIQANLKVIPAEWLAVYMDSFVEPPEDEERPSITTGEMVKATIVLSGYEELTRNPVADTGYFTINFGDIWDNPAVMGGNK